MNRRGFLTMLGLAPVVAVAPVVREERTLYLNYENGVLKLSAADVGTTIARSADGRMVVGSKGIQIS